MQSWWSVILFYQQTNVVTFTAEIIILPSVIVNVTRVSKTFCALVDVVQALRSMFLSGCVHSINVFGSYK